MDRPSTCRPSAKRLFLSGVLALSVANITVKLLGLIFKIPVANILSAEALGNGEGLGYFSSSYTVYTWLFMVATSGLPNGISIVISEARASGRHADASRVFRSTLFTFSLIGCGLFALMFFGSGGIASLIQNEGAAPAMAAIAPTLLFISVASVYRGYFYGFQTMLPCAVSEVIEAVFKLVFGWSGAFFAYQKGYSAPVVAAFAISGVTIGVFLGLVFLVFAKRYYEKKGRLAIADSLPTSPLPTEDRTGSALRRVLALSVPITLASSVMSLTGLIDVGTMMGRLQGIGYTPAEASALYGTYTMLAVPLYNLPVVLLSPISSSVIPLLTGYLAAGKRTAAKRVTESMLRIVLLFVIPASIGMSVFSYEILSLFYAPSRSAVAAPLLSLLSAATFLLGILTVSNAVLQANRMAGKTVISMSIGAAVKLVSGVLLVGNPRIGIYGVPLGTVLCYLVIVAINFGFMAKHLSVYPSVLGGIFRPFLAAGGAVLVGRYLLYPPLVTCLTARLATLISVAAVALMYLIFLFLLRAITRRDLSLLPGGEKIYAFLRKRNWIGDK